MLTATDHRGRTLIWSAIGLGFGQRDLATLRVGQIDRESYDLRRAKTGVDRYGDTPPLVWAHIEEYLKHTPRSASDLIFVTRNGQPIVHAKCDSVGLWWTKLRKGAGESPATLSGYYVLRHLGATEFGSRKGCSIGDMRQWLGHAASSAMADVYMHPVSPEDRKVVEWVRDCLEARDLNCW